MIQGIMSYFRANRAFVLCRCGTYSLIVRVLLLNGICLLILATNAVRLRDLPVFLGGSSDDYYASGSVEFGPYSAAATALLAKSDKIVFDSRNLLRGGHGVPMDNITSFNIIMTSNGDRPTLQPMLESIFPQLTSDDFLTLISDVNHLTVSETFANVHCNCTKILINNAKALGWWGHGSRTRWQKLLPGTFHMNADDDDLYMPNAMSIVRHWVSELNNTMFVFRMIRRWDDMISMIPPVWVTNGSVIQLGTVGTPCVVYRADRDRLPDWAGRYGGDGEFYSNLKKISEAVIVVPEVIYHVGQREDLLPFTNTLLRGGLAEPVEEVKNRRNRRRNDPDFSPYILPPPKWVGLISKTTTSWEPPEEGPKRPGPLDMIKLKKEHVIHLVELEIREKEKRIADALKLAKKLVLR